MIVLGQHITPEVNVFHDFRQKNYFWCNGNNPFSSYKSIISKKKKNNNPEQIISKPFLRGGGEN